MTVSDLINAALRRIGALASGETASNDEAQDALSRLNDLIDSWATERLTIYTITRTTWTIVSGTRDYSVGTGATVSAARPVSPNGLRIHFQDTSVSPTLEYPLMSLTDAAWQAIPQKTLTSALPTFWYYNPTYPTGTISLWLVPTSSTLQGVLYAPTQVSQFAALTDTISLPPGYQRMLRENLAVELAPEWGKQIAPSLFQSAMESKANVKRANERPIDLPVDPAVLNSRGGRYSIYSDTDV